MKVAVTSQSSSLDDPVDPRFGRCAYFLILETDGMESKAVKNQHADAASGAGVQAAQEVIGENVEALITGNIGPNAFQTLQGGNVQVYTGAEGTAREAIDSFQRGELEKTEGPTGPGGKGKGRRKK